MLRVKCIDTLLAIDLIKAGIKFIQLVNVFGKNDFSYHHPSSRVQIVTCHDYFFHPYHGLSFCAMTGCNTECSIRIEKLGIALTLAIVLAIDSS